MRGAEPGLLAHPAAKVRQVSFTLSRRVLDDQLVAVDAKREDEVRHRRLEDVVRGH